MTDRSTIENAANESSTVVLADENTRSRSNDNWTMGAGWRADWATNAVTARAETANAAMTRALDQPQLAPSTAPRASAPIPRISNAPPTASGSRVFCWSLVFGTQRAAPRNARRETGRLTRNSHRQEAVMSTPPSSGPQVAESAAVVIQIFTYFCTFSAGAEVKTRPRLEGVSTAAPAACRTRKATRTQIFELSPAPALAALKSVRRSRNPPFRPNRSARRPAGTRSA